MGKKVIIALLFTLLNTATCNAETVSDVLDIYGISGTTHLESTETNLQKATSDYTRIKKETAFADFYNEALNLADNSSLLDELYTSQASLQELELDLLDSVDCTFEEIQTKYNAYKSTLDRTNELLYIVGSYNNLPDPIYPEDDLMEAEMNKYNAEMEYSDALTNSDIGHVSDVIHPVQAPLNISAKFGNVVSKKDSSKVTKHNGVDLEASVGVGVLSLFKGEVKFADYVEETGETVVIDHGDGLETKYEFLEERYVKEGDKVLQYQKIGTIGKPCGEESGKPHLHLSVLYKDKAYDPEKLLVK